MKHYAFFSAITLVTIDEQNNIVPTIIDEAQVHKLAGIIENLFKFTKDEVKIDALVNIDQYELHQQLDKKADITYNIYFSCTTDKQINIIQQYIEQRLQEFNNYCFKSSWTYLNNQILYKNMLVTKNDVIALSNMSYNDYVYYNFDYIMN